MPPDASLCLPATFGGSVVPGLERSLRKEGGRRKEAGTIRAKAVLFLVVVNEGRPEKVIKNCRLGVTCSKRAQRIFRRKNYFR
jgi:hypothetical protein